MNHCIVLRCDDDYYCTPISADEAVLLRRGVGSQVFSGTEDIIDRVIKTCVYSSATDYVRAHIRVVAVLDETQAILIECGKPQHEVSGTGAG